MKKIQAMKSMLGTFPSPLQSAAAWRAQRNEFVVSPFRYSRLPYLLSNLVDMVRIIGNIDFLEFESVKVTTSCRLIKT